MAKSNSPLRSLVLNVAILAGFWLLGFAIVQVSQRTGIVWLAGTGQFAAAILGLLAAMRFNARFAAPLLLVFAVFSFAELSIHTTFGLRALQGGPRHFAVLIAATLGVITGSRFMRPLPAAS